MPIEETRRHDETRRDRWGGLDLVGNALGNWTTDRMPTCGSSQRACSVSST